MIGEKDIEMLFGKQLARIGDEELRGKVVKTFVLACRRGNWESVDALKKMPFTLLADTFGVNFVEHTIAVTEGAAALGRAQAEAYGRLPYAIDFDRLYAGGLLHDVGKLLEIEPDGRGGYRKSLPGKYARHPVSGAILAFPKAPLGEVSAALRINLPEANRRRFGAPRKERFLTSAGRTLN